MRRRRLTEPEWEAELQRAKETLAADVERHPLHRPRPEVLPPAVTPDTPLVVRTPPKRSRWGRPWARRAR